jgi:hypothetical protein
MGYSVVDVPAVGNCLFEAGDFHLNGKLTGQHKNIRADVRKQLSRMEVWADIGDSAALSR